MTRQVDCLQFVKVPGTDTLFVNSAVAAIEQSTETSHGVEMGHTLELHVFFIHLLDRFAAALSFVASIVCLLG